MTILTVYAMVSLVALVATGVTELKLRTYGYKLNEGVGAYIVPSLLPVLHFFFIKTIFCILFDMFIRHNREDMVELLKGSKEFAVKL